MPVIDGSVPDAGEVIWVDFGPPVGHQQGGRWPALVVSSRDYNAQASSLVVCPITRRSRDWPFEIPVPPFGLVSGFVLVDQIKVIDPAARAFNSAGRIPEETLADVRGKLATLLGIPTPG